HQPDFSHSLIFSRHQRGCCTPFSQAPSTELCINLFNTRTNISLCSTQFPWGSRINSNWSWWLQYCILIRKSQFRGGGSTPTTTPASEHGPSTPIPTRATPHLPHRDGSEDTPSTYSGW